MTKDEFIKKLSNPTGLDNNGKIAVCQYYIDNYALNIPEGSYIPYPLKINGGSVNAVNHAFRILQSRLNEFKQ